MVFGITGLGRSISRAIGRTNTRNQRLRDYKEKLAKLYDMPQTANVEAEIERVRREWENKEWTPNALAVRNQIASGEELPRYNRSKWPQEALNAANAGVPIDQILENHRKAFRAKAAGAVGGRSRRRARRSRRARHTRKH